MMWKEINTEKELQDFIKLYGEFHDSCLKELRYISGAFVNKDLRMHPINDQRKLTIILQRQADNFVVVELEFSELIILNLRPVDDSYTSEILDVSMFFENGKIYWGDSEWFREQREQYEGTWLCANKVRWRMLDDCIGKKEVYQNNE